MAIRAVFDSVRANRHHAALNKLDKAVDELELHGVVTGLPYQAREAVLPIRGKPFANIAFANIKMSGGRFCPTMLLIILNAPLFKVG